MTCKIVMVKIRLQVLNTLSDAIHYKFPQGSFAPLILTTLFISTCLEAMINYNFSNDKKTH